MRWVLKSPFDQNSIMINHNSNGDFKHHLVFGGRRVTQEGLITLFEWWFQKTHHYLMDILYDMYNYSWSSNKSD
jgi:hypothetical protein